MWHLGPIPVNWYGIGVHRRSRAIVGYSAGAFGGVRAAIALRAMLGEFGMSGIPSIFLIKGAGHVPGGRLADREGYERRIRKFLDELEWYARDAPPKCRLGEEPKLKAQVPL